MCPWYWLCFYSSSSSFGCISSFHITFKFICIFFLAKLLSILLLHFCVHIPINVDKIFVLKAVMIWFVLIHWRFHIVLFNFLCKYFCYTWLSYSLKFTIQFYKSLLKIEINLNSKFKFPDSIENITKHQIQTAREGLSSKQRCDTNKPC